MAITFGDLFRDEVCVNEVCVMGTRTPLTLKVQYGSTLHRKLHEAYETQTAVTFEDESFQDQSFVVLRFVLTSRSAEMQYTLGRVDKPQYTHKPQYVLGGVDGGIAHPLPPQPLPTPPPLTPLALSASPTPTMRPSPPLTPAQEAAQEAAQRALRQPQHRRAGLLGLDSVQD